MRKSNFGSITRERARARVTLAAADALATSMSKRADAREALPDGSTRRGVPADYKGDNPKLCNARTRSGRPCRALKLKGGRCKMHGGLSTGPRTPEGLARCAENLRRRRERNAPEP